MKDEPEFLQIMPATDWYVGFKMENGSISYHAIPFWVLFRENGSTYISSMSLCNEDGKEDGLWQLDKDTSNFYHYKFSPGKNLDDFQKEE